MHQKQSLLEIRRAPNPAEKRRGADIVFERTDTRGTRYVILACRCYESWEQWGAPTEILGDNVDDVEFWRHSRERV